MSKGSKKDLTKYYHVYQKYGYDTKDCLVLKKEIKALICQGYLRASVDQPKGTKASGRQPHLAIEPLVANHPIGNLVNAIAGGFSKGHHRQWEEPVLMQFLSFLE